MKLHLDQGLPRSTVAHLAAAGVSAVHVGDLGMASATDATILDTARQLMAVVVTLDADFHHLLAVGSLTSPSVIRVRIEGLRGEQLSAILIQVIAASRQELATGAAISVTENRIRIRSLPLS